MYWKRWPGGPPPEHLDAACLTVPATAPSFPPLPPRPADATAAQLEAIARLAWSDEAARQELGQRRGIESIAAGMRQVGPMRAGWRR